MTKEIMNLIDTSGKVYQHLYIMIESEREKRQALLRHDLPNVEVLMQAQQAMTMKLDGLEKKRLAAQAASGFSGKTSSQILALVDDETRSALNPVFQELRSASAQLQDLNRISMDIASAELRLFDPSARTKEETNGLYNASGKTGSYVTSGQSFREKI